MSSDSPHGRSATSSNPAGTAALPAEQSNPIQPRNRIHPSLSIRQGSISDSSMDPDRPRLRLLIPSSSMETPPPSQPVTSSQPALSTPRHRVCSWLASKTNHPNNGSTSSPLPPSPSSQPPSNDGLSGITAVESVPNLPPTSGSSALLPGSTRLPPHQRQRSWVSDSEGISVRDGPTFRHASTPYHVPPLAAYNALPDFVPIGNWPEFPQGIIGFIDFMDDAVVRALPYFPSSMLMQSSRRTDGRESGWWSHETIPTVLGREFWQRQDIERRSQNLEAAPNFQRGDSGNNRGYGVVSAWLGNMQVAERPAFRSDPSYAVLPERPVVVQAIKRLDFGHPSAFAGMQVGPGTVLRAGRCAFGHSPPFSGVLPANPGPLQTTERVQRALRGRGGRPESRGRRV